MTATILDLDAARRARAKPAQPVPIYARGDTVQFLPGTPYAGQVGFLIARRRAGVWTVLCLGGFTVVPATMFGRFELSPDGAA